MENSQCAEVPGNPWLSSKSARFSYLLQALGVEWNPFESPKLPGCEPSECCNVTPNSATMSTESAVELLMTVVDDVTEHSLQRLKQSVYWEKVDESELYSHLRKAVDQKSDDEMQNSIRNLLLHMNSLSSGEQHLWFLAQVLLSAYVERFQKPLVQALADPIFELASSKINQSFVFRRLLPAVLLIPSNRQSEFAQKILQVASPSCRLSTLSNICSSNHRWPQEIYPVLRLLLNPVGSAHEGNEEDRSSVWTSELYVAVVGAFSRQAQENPTLASSTQFANLLLFFLREHQSKLPSCTWPSLSRLAQQHTGFLKNPLCDLVAAICSSSSA